jgi:hypothetical protein
MISSIGAISLFAHQMLVNIPYSPETVSMIKNFMLIVSFDPIPVDSFHDGYFGEQQALSASFESLGYESQYMLYNMGSSNYIILAYPLTYLIYELISRGGENWFSRTAKQNLNSYTLPNIYAAVYTSQLVYLFMIALNFKHIISIGLKKALQEDRNA